MRQWTPPDFGEGYGDGEGYNARLAERMESEPSFRMALRIIEQWGHAPLHQSSARSERSQCVACLHTVVGLAEQERNNFYDALPPALRPEVSQASPRAQALPTRRQLLGGPYGWVPYAVRPTNCELPDDVNEAMSEDPTHHMALQFLHAAAVVVMNDAPMYLDCALAVCIAADRDRNELRHHPHLAEF
jgi:hypothetical protein